MTDAATILNDETELVPLGKLKPHPDNPRQGDVGAVVASIERHGFYGALIAQRSTGHVLAGNHRLKAARQLKMKAVPVTWVDVDDETATRILLADNRSSDLGTYDNAQLADLLTSLSQTDAGLDGLGYDGDDLDDLLRGIAGHTLPKVDAELEWSGMPEYHSEDKNSVFSCTVHFARDEDAEAFFALIGQSKGRSVWYPEHDGFVGSSVNDVYVAVPGDDETGDEPG